MKSFKRVLLSLLLVFTVFGLIACSSSTEENDQQKTQSEPTEENDTHGEKEVEPDQESELATQFPVTITDDSGEDVVIEEEPQRIVSVIPSATEIIFALGLGDKVVGVTENDNYPEEVKEIEKVGAFELNIEKIISLEPDLVVADVINGEAINQLRDKGVNVLVLGASSLEQTYEDILLTGKATGTEGKAEEILVSMKEDKALVESIVSQIPEEERKTVWIEIGEELFTAGSGTFLNELVETAGGKNIMADQEGWPQVSEEQVIEKNPDVILITYGSYVENAVEKVLDRSTWQDITAIQENQVYALNSDITERAGPRITEGLKAIAQILYPEHFKKD